MKKFENLYCLDKKGGIRVFTIHLEKDEDTGYENIVTSTGKLNGKKTTKITTITKGKNIGKANETSILEQAISEAQSKWNNKLDEGYKTDDMCSDKFGFGFEFCVEIGKILYNTNSDWNEKPMLATPYKKVKNLKYPMYIQPKLNGVRCMAKEENNDILLMSRGGKYYNIPHIKEQLGIIFMFYYKDSENPVNIILDGEIFKKGKTLQEITGFSRKESEDVDKSWLEYHIYDIAIPNTTQIERLSILVSIQKLVKDVKLPNIKFVTTEIVNSEFETMDKHNSYVENSYEGAILRPSKGNYHFGIRDKDLIKVKEFIDEEFTLVGFKITEGKSIGDSFVFKLKNNINDLEFYARPRGTREEKEYWHENVFRWIGEEATVRFQERTPDGLPHQAHVVTIRNYE